MKQKESPMLNRADMNQPLLNRASKTQLLHCMTCKMSIQFEDTEMHDKVHRHLLKTEAIYAPCRNKVCQSCYDFLPFGERHEARSQEFRCPSSACSSSWFGFNAFLTHVRQSHSSCQRGDDLETLREALYSLRESRNQKVSDFCRRRHITGRSGSVLSMDRDSDATIQSGTLRPRDIKSMLKLKARFDKICARLPRCILEDSDLNSESDASVIQTKVTMRTRSEPKLHRMQMESRHVQTSFVDGPPSHRDGERDMPVLAQDCTRRQQPDGLDASVKKTAKSEDASVQGTLVGSLVSKTTCTHDTPEMRPQAPVLESRSSSDKELPPHQSCSQPYFEESDAESQRDVTNDQVSRDSSSFADEDAVMDEKDPVLAQAHKASDDDRESSESGEILESSHEEYVTDLTRSTAMEVDKGVDEDGEVQVEEVEEVEAVEDVEQVDEVSEVEEVGEVEEVEAAEEVDEGEEAEEVKMVSQAMAAPDEIVANQKAKDQTTKISSQVSTISAAQAKEKKPSSNEPTESQRRPSPEARFSRTSRQSQDATRRDSEPQESFAQIKALAFTIKASSTKQHPQLVSQKQKLESSATKTVVISATGRSVHKSPLDPSIDRKKELQEDQYARENGIQRAKLYNVPEQQVKVLNPSKTSSQEYFAQLPFAIQSSDAAGSFKKELAFFGFPQIETSPGKRKLTCYMLSVLALLTANGRHVSETFRAYADVFDTRKSGQLASHTSVITTLGLFYNYIESFYSVRAQDHTRFWDYIISSLRSHPRIRDMHDEQTGGDPREFESELRECMLEELYKERQRPDEDFPDLYKVVQEMNGLVGKQVVSVTLCSTCPSGMRSNWSACAEFDLILTPESGTRLHTDLEEQLRGKLDSQLYNRAITGHAFTPGQSMKRVLERVVNLSFIINELTKGVDKQSQGCINGKNCQQDGSTGHAKEFKKLNHVKEGALVSFTITWLQSDGMPAQKPLHHVYVPEIMSVRQATGPIRLVPIGFIHRQDGHYFAEIFVNGSGSDAAWLLVDDGVIRRYEGLYPAFNETTYKVLCRVVGPSDDSLDRDPCAHYYHRLNRNNYPGEDDGEPDVRFETNKDYARRQQAQRSKPAVPKQSTQKTRVPKKKSDANRQHVSFDETKIEKLRRKFDPTIDLVSMPLCREFQASNLIASFLQFLTSSASQAEDRVVNVWGPFGSGKTSTLKYILYRNEMSEKNYTVCWHDCIYSANTKGLYRLYPAMESSLLCKSNDVKKSYSPSKQKLEKYFSGDYQARKQMEKELRDERVHAHKSLASLPDLSKPVFMVFDNADYLTTSPKVLEKILQWIQHGSAPVYGIFLSKHMLRNSFIKDMKMKNLLGKFEVNFDSYQPEQLRQIIQQRFNSVPGSVTKSETEVLIEQLIKYNLHLPNKKFKGDARLAMSQVCDVIDYALTRQPDCEQLRESDFRKFLLDVNKDDSIFPALKCLGLSELTLALGTLYLNRARPGSHVDFYNAVKLARKLAGSVATGRASIEFSNNAAIAAGCKLEANGIAVFGYLTSKIRLQISIVMPHDALINGLVDKKFVAQIRSKHESIDRMFVQVMNSSMPSMLTDEQSRSITEEKKEADQ